MGFVQTFTLHSSTRNEPGKRRMAFEFSLVCGHAILFCYFVACLSDECVPTSLSTMSGIVGSFSVKFVLRQSLWHTRNVVFPFNLWLVFGDQREARRFPLTVDTPIGYHCSVHLGEDRA